MLGDAAPHDVITLVLPAEPEYGRLARITTSSLAIRMRFPYPEVEDLRLAVDESIILLLRPEGGPGEITITFAVEPHGLTIDADSSAGSLQHWIDQGALARFEAIVADTVDSFAVDESGHHVHLVKHLTAPLPG
jgi:hypothetical protein